MSYKQYVSKTISGIFVNNRLKSFGYSTLAPFRLYTTTAKYFNTYHSLRKPSNDPVLGKATHRIANLKARTTN